MGKRGGWKVFLVERLGGIVLSLLGHSLRYEIEGAEYCRELRAEGVGVIFAFWHSQILPLAHLHRKQGIVVLVSEHRDGEYIARVLHRKGFRTARGSSTRGGVKGLKALVRAAREGRELAITPDGPRGPARVVKEGTVRTAQLSGHAILPLAAGAVRAWRASSWDRFMIPRPFSRVRVRYGAPIRVPRNADADAVERLVQELESALNRLTDEVDPPSAAEGGP